jgi:hypothetical protein
MRISADELQIEILSVSHLAVDRLQNLSGWTSDVERLQYWERVKFG